VRAIAAHGLRALLPPGFEGRIRRHRPEGGEDSYAVAQFGTFALPPATADFGNGAVQRMSTGDIFVGLLEYGPESVGSALFAETGLPRRVDPGEFARYASRDGTGVQSAMQRFFVEAGRPFTLYVVLGNHLRRRLLLEPLAQLLAGIHVEPRTSE
jgi:hypothetical protein